MIYTISFVLLFPVCIAIARARGLNAGAFGFNNANTGLLATTCSIICSNVGAGTFVAILLFSRVSPVIGFSLVVCYTAGLLLCAMLAPRVHRISNKHQTYSLVDLIVLRSGGVSVWKVWTPVAFVFILRSTVQLTALSLLIAEVMSIGFTTALVAATLVVASYSLIGGYRAATETDMFQAVIVIALIALVGYGLLDRPLDTNGFFDLGPYKPALLVGIILFIPFSPILAVDNWQRLATARSPKVARQGFIIAAFLCCGVYSIIWLAGLDGRSLGEDPISTFRSLMPDNWPWLADLLFIVAIVSSIDTFVMPLVSTFAIKDVELWKLRAIAAAIFLVTAITAWVSGEMLTSVIAAFSSLIVFLPAMAGTLFQQKTPKGAAWLSMNAGLVTSLVVVAFDKNLAALAGFAVSASVYGLLWKRYHVETAASVSHNNALQPHLSTLDEAG